MNKKGIGKYRRFSIMLYLDIVKNVDKVWFGTGDVSDISSPETTSFYFDNICTHRMGRGGWRWDDWSDRRLKWLHRLEKLGWLKCKKEGRYWKFKINKDIKDTDFIIDVM